MTHPFIPRLSALSWIVLATFLIAGCTNPASRFETAETAPPDFALAFTVSVTGAQAAVWAPDGDPLTTPSQTIIEPTRAMRVALGPGSTANYFPTVTRTLSPQAFDAVHRLAHEAGLLDGDGAIPADAEDKPAVIYDIEIHAHGRSRLVSISPDHSPAAADLLKLLVALRSPPVVTE